MCRLTFYLGEPICMADLVTRPSNSLINQSTHARERPEPLNGDGFGVAWYPEFRTEPTLFKSKTPAWSNANLHELAEVAHSTCILAHIRASTSGKFDVSEANCHPFRSGRFSFMHNGDVRGFSRIRRALLASLSDEAFAVIRGTTDTEHLFALAVDYLAQQSGESSCEMLANALEHTLKRVHELVAEHAAGTHLYLNLVLADGRHAAACRYSTDPNYIDSLYYNVGGKFQCVDGRCMMSPDRGDSRSVLISSEPLDADPSWQAVERNGFLMIDADRNLKQRQVRV
ncbi:MAG: class II glutamine amidotransferase [Pseudomonadota bacterium]